MPTIRTSRGLKSTIVFPEVRVLPAVFVFSKLMIGLDFTGFTLAERVPSLSRDLLYVAAGFGGEDD